MSIYYVSTLCAGDHGGPRLHRIGDAGEVIFSQMATTGDVKIASANFVYALILPDKLTVNIELDGNAIVDWESATQHHSMLRGNWQLVLNGGLYHTDEEFPVHKISLNEGARIIAPNISVTHLCVSTDSFASLYSARTVWDTLADGYYVEMTQDYCRKSDKAIIAPNQRFKKRSEYEASVGYNLIGHYALPSRAKKVNA